MHWENRSSRYILLASVSFVLIMFGTRFVTLRFGQVFPEQSSADRNHIAALEARIHALEGRTVEFDALNARLAKFEEANKHLNEEVQAARSVKPVVIYQSPKASSVSQTTNLKTETHKEVSPSEPTSDEDLSMTVHRGDSMQKVRRVFGRPLKVINLMYSERWSYDDYSRTSITFKDGGVSEWSGMPIEP